MPCQRMPRTLAERRAERRRQRSGKSETFMSKPESISASAPASGSEATCAKCGKPMRYNVPRLGPAGGFVHANTSSLMCGEATLRAAEWQFPHGSCVAKLSIAAGQTGEITAEDMDALTEMAALIKRQLVRRQGQPQNGAGQQPPPPT